MTVLVRRTPVAVASLMWQRTRRASTASRGPSTSVPIAPRRKARPLSRTISSAAATCLEYEPEPSSGAMLNQAIMPPSFCSGDLSFQDPSRPSVDSLLAGLADQTVTPRETARTDRHHGTLGRAGTMVTWILIPTALAARGGCSQGWGCGIH